MTYPSDTALYAIANRRIRRAAREGDVPLVDLATRFGVRCPDRVCESLLFEDGHANPDGYALVAEALDAFLAPHLLGVDRPEAR